MGLGSNGHDLLLQDYVLKGGFEKTSFAFESYGAHYYFRLTIKEGYALNIKTVRHLEK